MPNGRKMVRSIWKKKKYEHGFHQAGGRIDAPPPRLTTAAEERKAAKQRSELDGSAAKAERSKVTLPKLNWLSRAALGEKK